MPVSRWPVPPVERSDTIPANAQHRPCAPASVGRVTPADALGESTVTLAMRVIALILAVVVATAAASALAAEQWPTRALRILTATPAGGSPDFVSRLLAEKLGERLGQSVLVENSTTTGV